MSHRNPYPITAHSKLSSSSILVALLSLIRCQACKSWAWGWRGAGPNAKEGSSVPSYLFYSLLLRSSLSLVSTVGAHRQCSSTFGARLYHAIGCRRWAEGSVVSLRRVVLGEQMQFRSPFQTRLKCNSSSKERSRLTACSDAQTHPHQLTGSMGLTVGASTPSAIYPCLLSTPSSYSQLFCRQFTFAPALA